MAFTFTSLPWSFTLLFPDVIVVSDLNQKIGGSTDSEKKKARIGGFAYPIRPPSRGSANMFLGGKFLKKLWCCVGGNIAR